MSIAFNRRQIACLPISLGLVANCGFAHAQGTGRLSGDPKLQSIAPRKKLLLEDYSYRDPKGVWWKAPAGLCTDGASIPRILWNTAGNPWEEPYLPAAIIHDHYCDTMERSWEVTHRVFFDAMIARGTSYNEAVKKFWAVHYLGPRWDREFRWIGVLGSNKMPRSPIKKICARPPSYKSTPGEWSSPPGVDFSPNGVVAGVPSGGGVEEMNPNYEDPDLAVQLREYEKISRMVDQQKLGPDEVIAIFPELR